MREIKFRAWLKENHSGKEQMFYQNNQYLQSFLRRCCKFSNPDGREHEKYGNYELMQYTGLKDANGKYVYEGDVLGSKKKIIGHIVGGVRGYCYDVIYAKPLSNGETRWSLYSTITDDYKDAEVIGNIYENPELLK